MTAPVLTGMQDGLQNNEQEYMQFVIPFEYKELDQIPKPTNANIKIKPIPAKIVATTTYSGWYNKEESENKLRILCNHLKTDGFLVQEA